MLPVGEILQRIHGVVTDRNNTEPLFPDRLQFCSSSTSRILQKGHQSAERKKTTMAPFGPMIDLSVWFRPYWSLAENVGTGWLVAGPVLIFCPWSAAIGSTHARKAFFPYACDQNVNASSSAIMITGGPPVEIFVALASVALPPADSAQRWSASIEGKWTSATR